MGGFVRSITRRFFNVIAPPPVQAPVQAPILQTPEQGKKLGVALDNKLAEKAKLAGSGYGSSSVLTSQQGIEEEANVSKTVLGGTVQKRKKI